MIDKKSLFMYASMCPEFDQHTRGIKQITALADKYCEALDNDDESMKNNYISALMLKFWDQINNMYQKTRTADNFDYDDFYIKLYERINYACKYRAWQRPGSRVNAQQCIQMAISTEVKNIFYFANLNKYKVAAPANHFSIDTKVDSDDGEMTWADMLQDTDQSLRKVEDRIRDHAVVQYYIDQKKLVQAIIIDTICSGNCEKEVKKVISSIDPESGEKLRMINSHTEFWSHRLIQALSALPSDYAKYFSEKYNVVPEELNTAIDSVRKANNQKLYRFWDKTKADLSKHLDATGSLVK